MSIDVVSTYARDCQTRRTIAGVRLAPEHMLSKSVHAHRTWTGEAVMETWCGISADFERGARQTTDTISCLACGQASWRAAR